MASLRLAIGFSGRLKPAPTQTSFALVFRSVETRSLVGANFASLTRRRGLRITRLHAKREGSIASSLLLSPQSFALRGPHPFALRASGIPRPAPLLLLFPEKLCFSGICLGRALLCSGKAPQEFSRARLCGIFRERLCRNVKGRRRPSGFVCLIHCFKQSLVRKPCKSPPFFGGFFCGMLPVLKIRRLSRMIVTGL